MSNQPSREPNLTASLPEAPVERSTVDDIQGRGPADTPANAQSAAKGDWPAIAGYVITTVIGRGGMGRVFVGRDLTLDRNIAIKMLLPGRDVERFVIESKITARLPHPGIPPVHALGTLADGSHYIVMKLVGGRTLSDQLKERKTLNDDLSRWVQAFEQIAQAVGFAHTQGIVHRDLKPANIMVGVFGEVQVMDWGLAKDLQSRAHEQPVEGGRAAAPPPEMTQFGAILGTAGYMAPEQARGEAVDARADVFALGAILTVILTGKPPIIGTTKEELIDKSAAGELSDALARLDACGADSELIALAKRCLSPKAEDRPADARVVAKQAAAYRAGVEARLQQVQADQAAARAREGEQRKRRRLLVVGAGVVAAVLVAGIIGTSVGMVSASHEANEKEKARKAEKQRADGEAKAAAAEKLANQKERAATAVALKRLKQIEKANAVMESIFKGIDPRLPEKGGPAAD